MTIKEFLYLFGKTHGLSQAGIADLCGKAKGNLCRTLGNEYGMSMKVKTFVDMLEQLDCQMVIEDLNTEEDYIIIIDGEYEGYDVEDPILRIQS